MAKWQYIAGNQSRIKLFSKEKIRTLWGHGKTITYKGKKYRIGRMSYGDYFLEPTSWKGGETEGFASKTIWLENVEGKPNMLRIS